MSRVTKDPQIRMNEILDTAYALFHAHGYHATNVSDIVKAIHVAQGTFYYYFKSKEAVLEAIVSRELSKVMLKLEEIVADGTLPPPRKMERIFEIVLSDLQRGDHYVLDFLYTDEHLHLMDKFVRQGRILLLPHIRMVVEEGIAKNDFSVPYPDETMPFVSSLVESLYHALYQRRPREILERMFAIASRLLETALGLPTKALSLSVPLLPSMT